MAQEDKEFWCREWDKLVSDSYACSHCYLREYSGGYPDCPKLYNKYFIPIDSKCYKDK